MGISTSAVTLLSPTDPAVASADLGLPDDDTRLPDAPADVLAHLAGFLLGSDLLRLSLCNRQLHQVLRVDAAWKHRLWCVPKALSSGNAKQRYCQATSLFFRGSWAGTCKRNNRNTASCDSVPLPLAIFPSHRDISFDVWFALAAPTHPSSVATGGGVLVGAQDTQASNNGCVLPQQSECFAFIDANCGLHCSVLRDKPVIKRTIESHRWYHLALTYDHTNHHQRVYLNGQLAHTMEGTVQFPWLQYAQLGTGFLRDDDSTTKQHWCGFRGLIDEFRVSYIAWTPLQIQRLAQGKRTNAPMAYAHTRDLERGVYALGGSWLEVTCTRPAERVVEIINCRTPRLLVRHHKSQRMARDGTCTSAVKAKLKERSIWQLMRQCL